MEPTRLIKVFCICLLLGVLINVSGTHAITENLYPKEHITESHRGDPSEGDLRSKYVDYERMQSEVGQSFPITDIQTNNYIKIDFETLGDAEFVDDYYTNLGLTFEGAVVLSHKGNHDFLGFPPRSGIKLILNHPDYTIPGNVTVSFDPGITGDVYEAGGYVTGTSNVSMTAYCANGNPLGYVETGVANLADVGTPNQLLHLTTSTPIVAVVFFNGGEGDHTYTIDNFFFSSEQTCQIINAPFYSQDDSRWADDVYGGSVSRPWNSKTGQVDHIRNWGSALTSAAMMVSHHGLAQNGFTTTPKNLNDWLREDGNNGYSGGHLNPYKVAEYARTVGKIDLYHYDEIGPDNGVVNALLCNGSPTILHTKSFPYSGHFVLATGQAVGDLWSINDPGYYNLDSFSTSSYVSYRKFYPAQKDLSSIWVAAHAPVELLITDPAGRKTGFEPFTKTYLDEILDSSYFVETLGTKEGDTVNATIFSTGSPLSGEYRLILMGKESGAFEIDFHAYDEGGEYSTANLSGEIIENGFVYVTMNYATESGSQIEVYVSHIDDGKVFLPLVMNGDVIPAFEIQPVLTGPADGEIVFALQPELSWQIDPSLQPGTLFKYWVSSDPNLGDFDIEGWASAFDGTTTISEGLSVNTTYYWFAAYNYQTLDGWWEDGPKTDVRRFTISPEFSIPSAPVLLSPENGSTVDTRIPKLIWQVDYNLHPVADINYWISTSPTFEDGIFGWEMASKGSTTIKQNLKENTTYYWKAVFDYPAQDNEWLYGAESEVRSFTTGSGYTGPDQAQLLSPANGSTVDTHPVVLSWNPVAGAVEYQVRVLYDWCNFLCWSYYFTTDTSIQLFGGWIAAQSEYQWDVQSRNNQAWSAPSTQWTFSTGALADSSAPLFDAYRDLLHSIRGDDVNRSTLYAPNRLERDDRVPGLRLNR